MKKPAVWRHFLCNKAELRLDITLKCGKFSYLNKQIYIDLFFRTKFSMEGSAPQKSVLNSPSAI